MNIEEATKIVYPLRQPDTGQPLAPPACSDFERGVWFRAACTGLWYQSKEAAGDIDAWKEDGVLHEIEDSPNKEINK